jgi:3-phenylpropionate/trans-cinnamate dioxygenase ferredoxin subunit
MPFERALAATELAPGAHTKVIVGGQPILLSNLDGQFHAVHNVCLHRGGDLAAGEMQDGVVVCPLHFWGFDVKSGVCTQVPSMALKVFATKVENGEVYVEV